MAKIMALPPIPGVRDLQTLMAFIMNKEEYDARLEAMVTLQEEIHTLMGKVGKAVGWGSDGAIRTYGNRRKQLIGNV